MNGYYRTIANTDMDTNEKNGVITNWTVPKETA